MASDLECLKWLAALTTRARGLLNFVYNLCRKIVIYIKDFSKLQHNGDLTISRTWIYLFIIFWRPFLIFLVMFMTVWSINLQIMSMWQWRRYDFGDVIFHAQRVRTVYPILYKNRSPGKTKQDIHLIFSVFIYSNIVERINKVLKKTENRPETSKSAPSPFMFSIVTWKDQSPLTVLLQSYDRLL